MRYTHRTRSRAGYTLVEILLVVVIIALLSALVMPRIVGRGKEARVSAAQAQIDSHFSTALDLYEMDNGQYPTTDQGLDALVSKPTSPPEPRSWHGPYLKKGVPGDPWGNSYVYASPGTRNPKGYDLHSNGPDGAEGGGDDITSWSADKD